MFSCSSKIHSAPRHGDVRQSEERKRIRKKAGIQQGVFFVVFLHKVMPFCLAKNKL